jgi:hypothetical protein
MVLVVYVCAWRCVCLELVAAPVLYLAGVRAVFQGSGEVPI